MSRTIKEIEDDERQLNSRLIEVEVEIENHPEKMPFSRAIELDHVLQGHGKRLAELENELESIHRKLKALGDEKTQIVSSAPNGPGYGKLKEIVDALAKRDKLKLGKTVPSKKINAWIREYEGNGLALTAASIRKKLSELGYSTEKKKDD